MGSVLFDSSVYINHLRAGNGGALGARFLPRGTRVWLSAVVLEELLAGAAGSEVAAIVRLGRDFARLRRLIVPTLDDWTAAGHMLANFGARFGFAAIAHGRLTNDALIAAGASRMGISVVTANARDFARLASLRPFAWQLARPGA
jgi:predicted nucleic acid-binding protein